MKIRTFLAVTFSILLAACAPADTQTPVETAVPGATVTRVSPSPTESIIPPTPEALMERRGHVWVPGLNTLAGYAYRSFLQIPVGMAWGPDGFLYVADWTGRHIVRVAKDGSMDDLPFWRTVIPLQADGPRSVVFDSNGNLYTNNHGKIFRVDPSGNVTELQGIQGSPVGSIVISAQDELFYTDRSQTGALRKWDAAGWSVTVVDGLPFAENMVFGLDGSLYLTQMTKGHVLKVDVSSGAVSTFKEDVCGFDPCFLAVDREGDIWVRGIWSLSQFTPDGVMKPFIVDGNEYPGGPYNWHSSAGIAVDDEGGLWIASYNSKLMRLVPVTPGQPDPEFTMQVMSAGMETSSLGLGLEGELYAANLNDNTLWRINSDGTTAMLARDLPNGRVAIAVDSSGMIYLGLPTGEIVRLNPDGTLERYARIMTRSMVFGADGALYAIVENDGQPRSIARITGMDTFSTLADQIGGISLGSGDAHISPALDTGFYVVTETERNLFFVGYNGQGHLIANLSSLGGGGPVVMTASPVTGEIFFIPHGPYKLFRIDPQGKAEEYATGIYGDPWGMVVSRDGQWLYVAESGAIDKIPLGK
jgi:sugar lactone lactonase YvrE